MVYPMGSLHSSTFPVRKHLKSRNPALTIPRRHEPVASDTVFSDTPAVDSGVKHVEKLQFSFYLDLISPEIYNSRGSFSCLS